MAEVSDIDEAATIILARWFVPGYTDSSYDDRLREVPVFAG